LTLSSLLTRAEVAGLLKLSVRTIDRMRRRGWLVASKVGAAVRFVADDVFRFLAGRREVAR
jgi:excisionase family DNA binding protein